MVVQGRSQPSKHDRELRGPKHVAIIMDGNGRWATQKGLPRLAGHRAGVDNIIPVLESLSDYGVDFVTIYAFSTENWTRPKNEVDGLMTILQDALERQTRALHERGVKVVHVGRADRLGEELRDSVDRACRLTKDNRRMTLAVAFDYGGRAEILEAVKGMISDGVPVDGVTEESFGGYLYTSELPDPDLIIRTAGELRLSNFLLWQAAYSEYYSTRTLWPDLGSDDIKDAIEAFNRRRRRFGALDSDDNYARPDPGPNAEE